MSDLLYKSVSSRISLNKEEWELSRTLFLPQTVRKKQFLLKESEVCLHTIFVNKGCLRSYSIDKNSEEHITQFATEGWWIADLSSFLTGEPSIYNIEALEDSEILLLDKTSQEILFEKVPKFERYFRLLIQSSYVALHKRLLSTITNTAEEKYLRMQKAYPDIMQRVPQHMVASYLGLKPETLSRIRKKLSEEK
ncbi:MAG: Crp/Fnr family transcriptional regulator [Cytophagaceae bacterium]